VGFALVIAVVVILVLALFSNVRIEWVEDVHGGHRRKELKVTRRKRRAAGSPTRASRQNAVPRRRKRCLCIRATRRVRRGP
jgi:hypothetical protein